MELIAVNARISAPAMLRLKQLAKLQGKSYGEVLTDLLLAVPVESADWEGPLEAMQQRLEQLEAALESLRAGWAETAQNRAVSDAAAQGIPRAHLDRKTPEIAVEAGLSGSAGGDLMEDKVEAQPNHSLHPVPASPAPARLTVKEKIDELIASGERSPSKIARALNEAGYLTNTRTPFERSNPQITKAIKAVGG